MVQWVVFFEGLEPGRVHELQRKKKLRAAADFSTGRHAMGLYPSPRPAKGTLARATNPVVAPKPATKGK